MPSTSGFNFRAPTSTFVSDSVPSSGTGAMGGPAALELVTPFGLGLNGPAAQKRRHHTPPGAVVRAAASGSSAQRARRKARWSAPAPYALEADLADRGGAGAGVGAGADGGAGFSTDGEDEGEMEHSGVDGGEQLERVHHARPAIERERERPRKRRKDGAVNGDGNANGNANAAGSELGGH